MARIQIGVIGLGGVCQGGHLPAIERSKDLQLTAICDIDRDKLQVVGERYGIGEERRFTDYRDLIACADVQAVDIATPNNWHYPIAMDAAAAGKPFSVEKPITMNAEEAQRLAARVREKNLKSMVCFSYRFQKAARMARDLVSQGLLGDLYHANMQYFQAWGLPDWNAPLVWRLRKEIAASGALGDLGCHAIDLVRFVTQKEYLKVVADADTFVRERPLPEGGGTGKVDVDDYCNYLARMEGGLSASFLITRFAFGRGNYQRLELYGSKGSLVYTLDAGPNESPISVCFGQPMGTLKVFTPLPVPAKYEMDQMQSFADMILEKGDGLSATAEDGLMNQKVVDAVLNSFEQEKWMTIS